MPALNQHVAIWAGDSLIIHIPVKDAAGGNAVLLGATARWWAAKTAFAKGADAFVKKAIGSGVQIVGSELIITINPADTDGIDAGVYHHEAEVVFGDGSVSTVTTGNFVVHATIIPNP
jgi:hypothetical protein